MKTQQNSLVQHRHFCRFAVATSLFLMAFTLAASAFEESYDSLQFSLFGLAHYERNPLCPDGYMIDQIGFGAANYATVVVTVPTTGIYQINSQMETEYPRAMYLAVGSESGTQSTLSGTIFTGANFKIPVEYNMGTIPLTAGNNTLVWFNATSGKNDRCPYISQVTVSQ